MKTFTLIVLLLLSLSSAGIGKTSKPIGVKLNSTPVSFENYTAKGNLFSVLIPTGWNKLENDQMKNENQYELKLLAPGNDALDYLLVNITYYADACKTTERFFFELLHPEYQPQGESHGNLLNLSVSGRKATALDMKTFRYPVIGTEGKQIETVKQYVVIPLDKGFFVALFEAPENKSRENRWIFDKIVNSFKPLVTNKAGVKPLKEISNDEYKVYTDFLKTEKLSGFEVPQFFEYVCKGSVVFEKTAELKKKEMDSLANLSKSLGKEVLPLLQNFKLKNKEQHAIKDRILIHRVSILSEHKYNQTIHNSRLFREGPPPGLSDINYLSGVGFNKEKTAALFYVSHSGSPATSYYVLMEKKDKQWVIKNAVLDNMIIF